MGSGCSTCSVGPAGSALGCGRRSLASFRRSPHRCRCRCSLPTAPSNNGWRSTAGGLEAAALCTARAAGPVPARACCPSPSCSAAPSSPPPPSCSSCSDASPASSSPSPLVSDSPPPPHRRLLALARSSRFRCRALRLLSLCRCRLVRQDRRPDSNSLSSWYRPHCGWGGGWGLGGMG